MATSPLERPPLEREKLVFRNRGEARRFSERVIERVRRERRPDVERPQEIVEEEVAEEFAKHGQPVAIVREPWEHVPQEHAEAQQLVNYAFAHDLGAAIKRAEKSKYYPRNLDLFHDVLTGELYEALREQGLNRQPLLARFSLVAFVGVVALIIIVLLFAL